MGRGVVRLVDDLVLHKSMYISEDLDEETRK